MMETGRHNYNLETNTDYYTTTATQVEGGIAS